MKSAIRLKRTPAPFGPKLEGGKRNKDLWGEEAKTTREGGREEPVGGNGTAGSKYGTMVSRETGKSRKRDESTEKPITPARVTSRQENPKPNGKGAN